MKRLLLLLGIFVCTTSFIFAQDASIWKRTRYTRLSYAIGQTKAEGSSLEKGQFGFGIGYGNTYLFPKTPVVGMLKFGFDVNWVDYTIVKYKEETSKNGNFVSGGSSSEGFMDKLGNLGRYSMMIGVLGIGPNVTCAPFSSFSNQARFLKASLYFHYQPTVGMYMMSENGDFNASYAYCNMFRFGGQISWKVIGVGIEGFWGSGKFKPLDFGGFIFDDSLREALGMEVGSKYTRKFANTKLYISFNF